MEQWADDGAALIEALLDCKSADEAHDLIVNYTSEFSDLAERLRSITKNKNSEG